MSRAALRRLRQIVRLKESCLTNDLAHGRNRL